MRKLNNRPIFYACVSLCFGIVLSSYENAWKMLAVILMFSALLVGVYKLLSNGDGIPKAFTALIMLGFFLIGICAGLAQQLIYENRYENQKGEITCEIVEISKSKFVGGNIFVDGEKTPGKVVVEIENEKENNENSDKENENQNAYQVGDVVIFDGEIKPIPIFENGTINFQFSSNVQYRAEAERLEKINHEKSVKNTIKNAVLKASSDMFEDNQGISYAMMFGDSALVEYSSLSLLRRGGVAHIFAVSGLHIGLLFGLLKMFSWIKLRSSLFQKDTFNLLCLSVLIFYVYLCDFTASSMRAFFMIFVGMLITRQGACKDRLTAISLSAFILLLYSPYIIFTVGFQLSFLTVLGLVILPSKISNIFGILKDSKIVLAISFGVSAFISTALVACFHFGYLSTVSVLLNLIVVPIYSLVYVANLCGYALYFACKALSLDYIISAICPYFTNVIYDQTIEIFSKIDKLVPLAFDITIPFGVLIGLQGVMYINSSLISDEVDKKKKMKYSLAFLLVCIMPFCVSLALPKTSYVTFNGTETQPLTITIGNESFIFCETGGEIDFSTIETKYASVIVYDGYYRTVKTKYKGDIQVEIYAKFFPETMEGAHTLEEFKTVNKNIQMPEDRTIIYEDVKFYLGKDFVTVEFGGKKYKAGSSDKKYYAKNGYMTSDKHYITNTDR